MSTRGGNARGGRERSDEASSLRSRDIRNARLVREALNRIEPPLRTRRVEVAYVVDRFGNVVLTRMGEPSQVDFNAHDIAQMRGGTLTHNHPSGNSLSPGDVEFAATHQLAEIRAVTAHYRYSMRPPHGGWNRDLWQNRLRGFYLRHSVEVGNELTRAIAAGIMTEAEAQVQAMDEIWRRVAADTGLVYRRSAWK